MREVMPRGLRANCCSNVHWQILGGNKHSIVNVWANTKRGFRYQVDGQKVKTGKLQGAIDLAGVSEATTTPPWNEHTPAPPETVGLIRWLWRLLW